MNRIAIVLETLFDELLAGGDVGRLLRELADLPVAVLQDQQLFNCRQETPSVGTELDLATY